MSKQIKINQDTTACELAKILKKGPPRTKGVWFGDPWYLALAEANRRSDLANLEHSLKEERLRKQLVEARLETAHGKLELSNVESVLSGDTAHAPKRRK